MTYVVTEACIRCKYTDCVTVCPMDCFMEGPNFLVINPDECIDCSICVAECPVGAIVSDHEIAEDQHHFLDINRRLSQHPAWKRISRAKPPLPDHEHWATVTDKLSLLETEPI
ncbi:ferredoxin FdxA [Pollutimonas harenae]|uniref:Ferredoxin n=1 Tax=Pollutimonas harenae TaxID=657015 RepID=A0A853GPB2_9BURK|nr:ferredoxin FdxA [Pollutimonas harenae]NYT84878.1 ferredoxin family protein [Pollutimonas harenae]TEA72724.1 ferredoxin family protein [Pollutimonas harenae]